MEVGAQATDDSLDMGLAAAAETGPAASPEIGPAAAPELDN